MLTPEAFTKLRILRVIKGKGLAVGQHDLMVGLGISWEKDGTRLSSGTSTELLGDVKDITKPNLWFLMKQGNWDQKRPDEYLWVRHYRQVQPLALEEYFRALASDRPDVEVPRLLASEKPEVVRRALRYVAGGIWPWPYDPDWIEMRYSTPVQDGHELPEQAENVWRVVRSGAEENRPHALSVYGDLKGRECLPSVRALLADKDPLVRGIAVGLRLRYRDESALAELPSAIRGVDQGWLAGRLVEEMSRWGDERLVPSLVSYLQNCQFSLLNEEEPEKEDEEDDLGIVALDARRALRKITGHWFPLDVERSAVAWRKAALITGNEERRALLAQLIPGRDSPLVAELGGRIPQVTKAPKEATDEVYGAPGLYGDGGTAVPVTVKITNITTEAMWIARRPAWVSIGCRGNSSSYGDFLGRGPVSRDGLVQLGPGEAIETAVELPGSFLLTGRASRRLVLSYLDNGNAIGLNAWVGTLRVKQSHGGAEPKTAK